MLKILLNLLILILSLEAFSKGLPCQTLFSPARAPLQKILPKRIPRLHNLVLIDAHNGHHLSLRQLRVDLKAVMIKTRVPIDASHNAHFLVQSYEAPRGPKQFMSVQVSGFSDRSTPISLEQLPPQHLVLESLQSTISFVLGNYGRRAWTEDFKKGLYRDNLRYARQSKYLTIRDGFEIISPVLGNLKLVEARSAFGEKLPLENKFNIVLEPNAGLKVEPSNFAISKEGGPPVFAELLVHFVKAAQEIVERPNHIPNKDVFFTYADQTSLRLYQPLGFEKLFEQPLEYQGTKWWILKAPAEKLIDLRVIIERLRTTWPANYAQGLELKLRVLKEPTMPSDGTDKVLLSAHGHQLGIFKFEHIAFNGSHSIQHLQVTFDGFLISDFFVRVSADGKSLIDARVLSRDQPVHDWLGLEEPREFVYIEPNEIRVQSRLSTVPMSLVIPFSALKGVLEPPPILPF